jgi:hypothetical protein
MRADVLVEVRLWVRRITKLRQSVIDRASDSVCRISNSAIKIKYNRILHLFSHNVLLTGPALFARSGAAVG